jgi:dihydropteroate synthase
MSQPPWLSDECPVIMGILNLTPDSFSDGGELTDLSAVLRRAEAMASAGAHLLDLGAVSTRPGAPEVSAQEEMRRLLPAVEALAKEGFAALSVDTFRASVAAEALDRGVAMINDVRGGYEAGMAELMAERKPWVCLMHMKGRPQTMQAGAIDYSDVVSEVGAWLRESVERVCQAGLPRGNVVVDPGIGFGKTDAHNLALTLAGSTLRQQTGCGVLYGASRKSIVGRIASVDEPQERLAGSLSLAGAAYRSGARVFRVHDVAQTVQYLALEGAMREHQALTRAHQD